MMYAPNSKDVSQGKLLYKGEHEKKHAVWTTCMKETRGCQHYLRGYEYTKAPTIWMVGRYSQSQLPIRIGDRVMEYKLYHSYEAHNVLSSARSAARLCKFQIPSGLYYASQAKANA